MWKGFWSARPVDDPVQAQREIELGNTAEDERRLDVARAHYLRALELAPRLARVHLNLGNLHLIEGDVDAALAAYRRALELEPGHAGAWFNLANVSYRRRELTQAREAYERCLALAPAHDEAELGLALVLADLGLHEDEMAAYRRILQRRPEFAGARANYAQALAAGKQYAAAAAQWEQLLAREPRYPYAAGQACAMRAYACDWDGLRERCAAVERDAEAGLPAAIPFHLAILGHSPVAQLQAGRRYSADRYPASPQPFAHPPAAPGRIRIAYVSADFHRHATAALTARLFELHDRGRFEVHAWSFGPDDASPMRQRLQSAFEHFHDVRGQSDEAIARAIHASRCDIAIDLKGYTADARPAIFSARPAPVQASWLGFPGTSGNPAIDYFVADPRALPASDLGYFSERVVWLPDSYQANDDTRAIAAAAPTRRELGLPEAGFVWCCFNNNFKITPQVYAIWMRLLQAHAHSVLWLLADNPEAQANLRAAAHAQGVDPERLVFAPRVDLPAHLARQARADLFLDTLPCNAHTTASDALWAGLPVLTCTGGTFAGRVAASLVHAAGLPELATTSLAEYEQLAARLASDPARLARIRERLGRANRELPLFDSARFARHLESAFEEMHRRRLAGLAPAHFAVQAGGAIAALA